MVSQTLSGCPSATDSEEKILRRAINEDRESGLGSTLDRELGRRMRILTNHDTLIYRPYFHDVNAEFSSYIIRSNSGPFDAYPADRGIVSSRDPGNSRNGPITYLDSPRPVKTEPPGPGSPRREKYLLQLDSRRSDQGT